MRRHIGGLLALLLLVGCAGAAAPTLVAPALVPTMAPPTEPPPPTQTPGAGTPTAQPPPTEASVVFVAPAAGEPVDRGTPLTLVVDAAAPSGVRLVTFTSNGQNIGQVRGMDQQTVRLEQRWSPPYAGTHELVATLGDREGNVIRSETLRLRVVDQAMLAANAPLWAAVEANVTGIRGLSKQETFVPSLLSRTELRQRLLADSFYSEEDARRDALVYSAFDFMAPDFDLYSLQWRAVGESIAGFYDPATKEFVVVSDDNQMNALEEWVYAHEFMHALQDQYFDLALYTDTSLSGDANIAIRALAEGEAELLQEQYVDRGYLTQDQLVEIYNLVSRRRPSGTSHIPLILSTTFYFPYQTGLAFTTALHARGGWPALNQAWQNPPQSTEQILHPERYLAGDAPQLVSLAPLTDTLGAGWSLLESDVFGEFLLREYLGQQLSAAEVDSAATGWGGDAFAVYWNEEKQQQVMALRVVWDSATDATQFASAFSRYAVWRADGVAQIDTPDGVCWQTTDALCLYTRPGETLVVRAPDVALAQKIAVSQ